MAKRYFEQGLARRVKIIYKIFSHIILNFPIDRDKPINDDELDDVLIYINSLYINLHGAVDNLSWVIAYKLNIDPALEPQSVNIFKKKFLNKITFTKNCKPFFDYYNSFKDWYWEEFTSRRHPSAHRLPLYIPHRAFESKDQNDLYNDLYKRFFDEFNKQNYEKSEDLLNEMDAMGRFIPFFTYNFEEFFPIYPTITNDTQKVFNIIETTISFLAVIN
jgi:hypothetical protein